MIGALALTLIALALFTANLTQYRKFQPASLDMTPIVEFLAKDNHDHWRYLTLGFGDQMAWLSAQTNALNVEGNYHSARRLPELTSTPIERLDGAKFTSIPGLGSLQAFLTNPQRYNLKYVFVNDDFYEPLLYFAGWHRLGILENDVQVWERADVPPLPAAIPAQVYPAWQRLMWGTLPVGSFFVVAVVFFFTGVLVPRFHLSLQRLPVLGMIVRWPMIRFWLISDDRGKPLPPSEDWQLWRRITRRLFPEIRLNPRPLRVVYGILLLLAIMIMLVFSARRLLINTQSPEAIVLAYYDALDFKRFSESYTYLETDLTREEYLRWLSLQGGILASFAKLENLYIDMQPGDSGVFHVHTTAEWLTALGTYVVEEDWVLSQASGSWRLMLNVDAPPLPRETFITTSEVELYLDLPISTLDETALNRGTLDRALLSVSPVSVAYLPAVPIGFTPESYDASRITGRFEGLISVMGAVTNRASFPAHITITAVLRDAAGARLAETNVMDVMIHQIWPQETTPFRVNFAGADAANILDIGSVASVDLIVQGVPTSFNLGRPLVLLDPQTLYNSGLKMVDIPRIMFVTPDESDGIAWVDNVYLQRAIAPDESLTFERPLPPADLLRMDVPVTVSGPSLAPRRGDIPTIILQGYSR